MKRFLISLLLLLALTLIACQRANPAQDTTTTPTTEATDPAATNEAEAIPTITLGTIILAEGELVAVNPALPLGFEVGGRLLALAVQPGDLVAGGDLLATLDDSTLQETVQSAELEVAQAENSLDQAQLSLDELLGWEPDELAVALAEANLAAAEAGLVNAQTQDAAAGNSLTSSRVTVEQAEQGLVDAQTAYDTAYDPGREWELGIEWMRQALENERTAAERNLEFAQQNLEVARAQYSLAAAGLSNDNAVSAEATVLTAQQALEQAQEGPTATEIAAAELNVSQAELSLEQSRLNLEKAQEALNQDELLAPWSGIVVAVEAAPGAIVAAGTPVVTLLDTTNLQFHTTNLSERDLTQLRPEQPVEIILKSYPDQPLQGTIAGIGAQPSGVVGDAAVFPVRIDLVVNELDLRPGMTGRAEIRNDS